jgi:MFS family permease
MAFVGFFIGAYVDRLGPRRPMLAGTAMLSTALLATSAITELWQWILLRGVLGMLGAALLGNLVVSITLSKWFVEQRARVFGLASIGVSLAGVVLPPVMTWAVDEFGWRAAWRMLAVGIVVLGLPTALVMRRQPEDMGLYPDGKSAEEMASGGGAAAVADYANSFTRAQAIRTKALYQLVMAFGLGTLGLITMIIITIPYLTDSGFSRGTAALMVSVLAIPAGVSKPVWGYMADHWSERLSTALSFLMNTVALVVIVAAVQAHSTWLLGVGYFVVGWGIGGQIPLQETIWATYFGRRYIGTVRSAALPFTMLLGASGPILVAYYYDQTGSYSGAIYAVAAGWAVAAWIIMFARRPTLHAAAAEPASA